MFDFTRTHNLGSLTKSDIGKEVTLSGWVNKRRDHGGLIFIDLRDFFGITQLIIDPKKTKILHEKANSIRLEYVISVKGTVIQRKEGMINKKMKTGEIEIDVKKLEILSPSKTPPFSISDEFLEVNDEIRLKYRYLDIRRGDIAKKLQTRHLITLTTRNFLSKKGFIEMETPILSKTTPEGARDYLVPSRIYPGNFYALPQSPQLFKQLLMISGMDKYFQIAKCFRDEDLRSDRQPEFTHIDIEMSFEKPETIFSLIENLMKEIFKNCLEKELKTPFPRLSYKEALEKYGSDKPDIRFDMQLFRLDEIIEKSNFNVLKDILKSGGIVKALSVKKGAEISRKEIDEYSNFVKKFGISGLCFMKSQETFTSNIVKFFSPELLKEIENLLKVEREDLILIAAGKESFVNKALDHLRRRIAKQRNLIPQNFYKFLWVTDFPLFSFKEDTKELETEHHPFTSPNLEDLDLLEKDPMKVRALAYDLVLNGYELASGSQRIHSSILQEKIFKILKFSKEDIENKFGYFIEALKYGTPPHAGIAIGLDRLSMVLTNTENIRDVIAFPKTQKATDLMTKSPSTPDENQLKELNIKAVES